MAISPRLDLRQTQSLVMTPQLQQAIKLLQLSNLEVTAYVEQELEQNPMLERDEGEGAPEAAAEGEGSELNGKADAANDEVLLDPVGAGKDPETPLDTDNGNLWTEEAGEGGSAFERAGRTGGSANFDDSDFDIDQSAARQTTLREHLLQQINIDVEDPADRIIAAHMVEIVDESGYFTGDAAQIAALLQCPQARITALLGRLQRLDPPGVFACSLKECLALQLAQRDRLDPAMAALLDHLDLLAKRDMAAMLRVCGVSQEDLADMIAEIKALNPKPGLAFDSSVTQPVVPDVLMRPLAGGGWHIELNQDTLPRVLVNTRYYAKISKEARTTEAKQFIAERFQSASWLVKSLHQRAQTILKVATEIVRQQDGFFRHGVRYLKPLVLRDIATAISMHESTVSRVTTNKYIAAPHGVCELKYFFTSAISAVDGGEDHSAKSVRFRIKSLIDEEPNNGVLSDDRIVDLLKKEGVDIARRTVAKYREAMRIPASVQRRREKALHVVADGEGRPSP
ncbi:MAG: RNA polymerase factor sigma-54 [Proteobacteria bacterium]|nr:RNA polymerase factor sigma-54 [Pseudomonadota bacterium]